MTGNGLNRLVARLGFGQFRDGVVAQIVESQPGAVANSTALARRK
jgi:hypothetical protein